MIKNYIETVTIIDNTEGEVEGLIKKFKRNNILYEYFHPKKFNSANFKLKNRKLIFLDLYLNDSAAQNASSQIASIRSYFRRIIGKNFGLYGIVLWTKHPEDLEEFKEKIFSDGNDYTLPVFVVGLDKNYYLCNGFSTLFDDIKNALEENVPAKFFIQWDNAIKKGKTQVVEDLYSLVDGYKTRDKNLEFLLYNLAKNQTGIHPSEQGDYPLYQDAYKAFMELLFYESSNQILNTKCNLFSSLENLEYTIEDRSNKIIKRNYKDDYTYDNNDVPSRGQDRIASQITAVKLINDSLSKKFYKINTKILLDEKINHKNIVPGNIYQIEDDKSPFIIEAYKEVNGDIPIVIEVTPPCDFANINKIHPKLIGGVITKYSNSRIKSFNKDYYYKEIYPLSLDGYDDPMIIAFDFRHIGVVKKTDLDKRSKFKLKYRAKDKLFADILQKSSSHFSRLGLSVFHL